MLQISTVYHTNYAATSLHRRLRRSLLLASIVPLMLGLTILVATACSSGGSTEGQSSNLADKGLCANSCPKPCGEDNDCETASGQLCCDYGELGKACVAAAACPRFCEADPECETQAGEACLRTTLLSSDSICTSPDDALKLCKGDGDCTEGDKCCTIYDEPFCLPPESCPKSCAKSSVCDTGMGEVCCATVGMNDPTLKADGLCLHPDKFNCPKACATSADCDNKAGELCCNGVCSTSCPKECSSSSECTNQLCCKTRAVDSPWLSGKQTPVYPSGGIAPLNQPNPGTACPGYAGSDQCCVAGDPCGRAGNGQCDCYGTCAWDRGDCSSSDPRFCPGYRFGDGCCQLSDPCNFANDGVCDCDGMCQWDSRDCSGGRSSGYDSASYPACDGCY